jgi:hypothetical protein
MPIDFSGFGDSLARGLGQIPPIAIALGLLAGPTVALIGYRLVAVARRMQTAPEVAAAPLWVCRDCRSVNELRVSRCYHCGLERDTAAELEVIVDQPASRPMTFDAPAGSPFAALGGNVDTAPVAGPSARHGVPVMADPAAGRAPVAVGPGPADEAAAGSAAATDAAATDAAMSGPASEADLAPALERRA